jgi:2-polyprenyl-6-methoxyphenol hydroxylase-like FAD-dependent oxidoreductase
MRVAVIGCGMGGPTFATIMARKGFRNITLFERASKLGAIGAGILLQPTGQGVLQRLGLWEDAWNLGKPVRRLEALSPTGKSILDLDYHFLPEYPCGGFGIHRGALFQLLYRAAQAEGVQIRTSCEIAHLTDQRNGEVLLRDSGGNDRGKFDLVVLSSGVRSHVKGDFLPQSKIRSYRWGAWWTSLPDQEQIFGDVLFQIYEKTNRLVGFLPTGTLNGYNSEVPLVSMFWSLKTDGMESKTGLNKNEFQGLKQEILRLAPRAVSLIEELKEPQQMVLATYADGWLSSWSAGVVVAMGDAAHPMSPHLGQGTNLALMDAEALAEAVAARPDRLDLAFAQYEQERRQHVEFYQWISRMMMPFFMHLDCCVISLFPRYVKLHGRGTICWRFWLALKNLRGRISKVRFSISFTSFRILEILDLGCLSLLTVKRRVKELA